MWRLESCGNRPKRWMKNLYHLYYGEEFVCAVGFGYNSESVDKHLERFKEAIQFLNMREQTRQNLSNAEGEVFIGTVKLNDVPPLEAHKYIPVLKDATLELSSGTFDAIGTIWDGMPEHFAIPVNEKGEGPADVAESGEKWKEGDAAAEICWCPKGFKCLVVPAKKLH